MLSSSTPTHPSDKNSNNNPLKLNTLSKQAPPPPPLSSSSSNSTRLMEEVWKDINLASLNDQNTRPMTSGTFGGILFQDFLARPFSINDPPNIMSSSSSPCSASASASPTPHPLTALSLGSRPQFHFDHHPLGAKGGVLVHQQPHHPDASKVPGGVSCFGANPSYPFETLACSSSLPCFGSKRFDEPADAIPGDRRNKRMIKNRESAARSRARKQEKIASSS